MSGSEASVDRRQLLASLLEFQAPSVRRSMLQLLTTGGAYLSMLALMYAALQVSFWLALPLAVPAAGLVVRLFIIQHDCGHGSYFRSARGNAAVGWLCSLATFTPYASWRRQHAGHHAVWNNLDRRENADLYSTCLTVAEYTALPPIRRRLYRLVRHPLVTQVLLPPLVFLVLYRVPFDTPRSWRRERRGVHATNLALCAALGALALLLGWSAVALIELPVMLFASIAGVWLFSVQHRFEDAEWMRQGEWTAMRAALHGSSYLELPRWLQWFTGNIGFHHVHHLVPRVPNYRLEACHAALAGRAGPVRRLSFADAWRAPSFALWDEVAARMTPFPRSERRRG